MKPKICPGSRIQIYDEHSKVLQKLDWLDAGGFWGEGSGKVGNLHGHRVKRIRLVCSKCGRRVKSSIRVGPDADYIAHTLPPHKIHRWWKRTKTSERR